jgi:8-oxo-dGTP pyrophosphatase MutT (NUDIX family)
MKFLVSAGVIVFRIKDGVREYLLLHHPDGHWDFAKGKMEQGESKRETALRELKEEANISADIIDGFQEELSYMFRQRGDLIKKTVYFFVGEAEMPHVTLSHEHDDFDWLPYQEASEKLTFKNARELLTKVEQFLLRK